MSYEGKMLKELNMPSKEEVGKELLITLFKNNGRIKEFSSNEDIVYKIAEEFQLTKEQKEAYLTTIYKKENRQKKSYLWHRLLFRAADELAKKKLISRPTKTKILTNKREWMLLEDGYNKALKLMELSISDKEYLYIKSYEVETIVRKIIGKVPPQNYSPFDKEKKVKSIKRTYSFRQRGFRQAVIEVYDFRCAICGLKMYSPNSLRWEVEAAHIVPHNQMGRDDIWNGISLCRLHHWCFDTGWLTITDDFKMKVSSKYRNLPDNFGKFGGVDLFDQALRIDSKILLPKHVENYPHRSSIIWHRENIFHE